MSIPAETGVWMRGMLVTEGECMIFLGNFWVKWNKYSNLRISRGLWIDSVISVIIIKGNHSMACEVVSSFVYIVEKTNFSLIEAFVYWSESWRCQVNAPLLIKNTVIKSIYVNVLPIILVQLLVVSFYHLCAQKVTIRRVLNHTCLDLLMEKSLKFRSHLLIKVQIWNLENVKQFVLYPDTDILWWWAFTEPWISLDQMLWSYKIPPKNQHEGYHMRK